MVWTQLGTVQDQVGRILIGRSHLQLSGKIRFDFEDLINMIVWQHYLDYFLGKIVSLSKMCYIYFQIKKEENQIMF